MGCDSSARSTKRHKDAPTWESLAIPHINIYNPHRYAMATPFYAGQRFRLSLMTRVGVRSRTWQPRFTRGNVSDMGSSQFPTGARRWQPRFTRGNVSDTSWRTGRTSPMTWQPRFTRGNVSAPPVPPCSCSCAGNGNPALRGATFQRRTPVARTRGYRHMATPFYAGQRFSTTSSAMLL